MKILVIPYNLLAHYLRCIALVNKIELPADITFLKSGKYDNFVEQNNYKLTNEALNSYSTAIDKSESFDFTWINNESVSDTVNSLINIIKSENPDYIIGDTFLGLRVAAEYCRIPLISILNAYLTHFYKGHRPVPHNHRANLFKAGVPKLAWHRILKSVEKQTLRNVHKPFRQIRKELHLNEYKDLFDEFAGAYNLLCDDPYIFPSVNLPAKTDYCGPLLYQYNSSNPKLLEFLENRRNKKNILITMGSTGKTSSVGDLKNEFWSDYNIILTGAPKDEQKDNIYYTNFINYDEVANHLDLIICHGGNGTVYQAINYNVSVIAIPRIFDQEWNAYRFKELSICKVWFPDGKI
ncbi:MAG: hypothetical protein C0596_13600 [Marinilabiliales bacterium]|nr:MAG: hypothetical protein C0596_13600 [Marinilabiliales bacterium]